MKKYLLLLLILLIPTNVFAGVCEPNKVIIESVTLENKTDGVIEKEEAHIDGKNININLSMKEVGDTANYIISVKNESEEDYVLDETSFNKSTEYIKYTINTDNNVIPGGSKKEVHLKVEYTKEVPMEALTEGRYVDNNITNINVASNPKEAEPTSTPVPSITPTPINNNPVEVPNTFASTNTYIIVIIVILLAVGIYYYRKNKYVTLTTLLIGIILIVSSRSSFALCTTNIVVESNVEIEKSYAMFLSGREVNTRMKNYVSVDSSYQTEDYTITNIERYTGIPDSRYLIDENKISTDESMYPIYMWRKDDKDNTTIYWYTEATNVYYNPNSNYFYYSLKQINTISNISDISSEYVTNMSNMFGATGYDSTVFTLDLGDKFDTSNVTNMSGMFSCAGYSSTVFTLDLGDKFDTSKVTDMSNMFFSTGHKSTVFTLDLGDKFDTSKVTDMYYMFDSTGYRSTVFTLDLGDKFDTSNVTDMSYMFANAGYTNPSFVLDLGDKFDTSNVTDMSSMFNHTGYSSTIFTLDLGDKFDTSNVTNMAYMFSSTGYNNPNFTLNLGNNFDTSNVTSMRCMFSTVGYSNTNFVLDLGDKFDTSKVTDMWYMFNGFQGTTIYATTSFVTTSVINSTDMFNNCTNLVGYEGTTYNSSNPKDKTYAHLDEGPSNPGYFTGLHYKV